MVEDGIVDKGAYLEPAVYRQTVVDMSGDMPQLRTSSL